MVAIRGDIYIYIQGATFHVKASFNDAGGSR